jgi:Ca-activated chloride channel homolog
VPGGGTDFKAALEIATAQLVQSGLKTLHVILLTDGDTNRGASDHAAVLAAMSRLGISVTTIRIGEDDVNLEFLQQISRQTGGRFYHVDDIEMLPQLMINDTRQAKGEKPGEPAEAQPEKPEEAAEGPLRPRIEDATEVVRGLGERPFPVLRSVPPSKLKPGADLVLSVFEEGREGKKQPLLATWQYGLGRVAAFAFDPTQPDVAVWSAWPGFAKLWSQLVRWAIREETPWETRQTVRYREGSPYLEVQTFDEMGEATLTAQLVTDGARAVDLALTPAAPRIYRAPLPPLSPGKYALLLARTSPEKPPVQKREMVVVEASADESSSAELARKLPDLDLLRDITAATGGSVNPTVDELAAHHGASRVVRRPLGWLLIPLALALLLVDVALRMRADR